MSNGWNSHVESPQQPFHITVSNATDSPQLMKVSKKTPSFIGKKKKEKHLQNVKKLGKCLMSWVNLAKVTNHPPSPHAPVLWWRGLDIYIYIHVHMEREKAREYCKSIIRNLCQTYRIMACAAAWRAFWASFSKDLGMVMLDKDLQPLKASRSMVVTDCGTVRLVNDSQRSRMYILCSCACMAGLWLPNHSSLIMNL